MIITAVRSQIDFNGRPIDRSINDNIIIYLYIVQRSRRVVDGVWFPFFITPCINTDLKKASVAIMLFVAYGVLRSAVQYNCDQVARQTDRQQLI